MIRDQEARLCNLQGLNLHRGEAEKLSSSEANRLRLKPWQTRRMGYSLSVRDSMMIAHSFKGREFGPAQQMHGATYVVDCEFITSELVPGLNWVVDIGEASIALKEVLSKFNYKNLDDLEEFKGQNTTTEFMCKQVFDGVAQRFKGSFVGKIRVKLAESHTAWASYTGTVS